MKTAHIQAALKAAYKSSEYALMWEVGDATGSRVSRHADAVAMNLWPSRGLLIEGFEIKVSRSDWRRELDNPAKSAAVQQYCDRWWVVAPTGIIQLHEVPALWGVKEVTEKGVVKTVKAAPDLDSVIPKNSPVRSFVAAMLRRSSDEHAGMIEEIVKEKLTKLRESDESRIEREVERRSRAATNAEKVKELMASLGLFRLDDSYAVKDFVDTYKLGRKIKSTNLASLHYTADNLRRTADTVSEVYKSLFPDCEDSCAV